MICVKGGGSVGFKPTSPPLPWQWPPSCGCGPHGRRTDEEEGSEEAMPAPFRTWTGLGLAQASDQLKHDTGLTMLSQSGSTPGGAISQVSLGWNSVENDSDPPLRYPAPKTADHIVQESVPRPAPLKHTFCGRIVDEANSRVTHLFSQNGQWHDLHH